MGLKTLKFKAFLIKQVRNSGLSWKDKNKLITAIVWRPDVVAMFNVHIEEAVRSLNADEQEVVCGGPFDSIDWENFDWEAAAEFWVKLIEAIAKIIIAVI